MEYLTRAEAMQMFKISQATIDRWVKDIKEHYSKRYGDTAVLKAGGIVRIEKAALLDYLVNKNRLTRGEAVPAFRR